MRRLISVLLVLVGLAAAVYFGIVFMLVGGIEEIVHAATVHPVLVSNIVWGSVRVFFCEAAGLLVWAGIGLALLIWPEEARFNPYTVNRGRSATRVLSNGRTTRRYSRSSKANGIV